MPERLGKSDVGVHLQQEIGDAGARHLAVEVEDQIFHPLRGGGLELFDVEDAILNGAAGEAGQAAMAAFREARREVYAMAAELMRDEEPGVDFGF